MDSSAQTLETASALRVQAKTGSHLFKFFGYSLTKGIGVGECYNSGVFTIGGHDWVIEYYPDGRHNQNYMSFFLRLRSQATNVKARVTLTILQQDGVPSDMSRSVVTTFNSTGDDQCYYATETSKFEASGCLKDDAFTMKCTITVVKGVNLKIINSINVPPSNLNQHLLNLLESGKGADVTFEVNGERFMAHRNVLATRSAVFNAELFGCMKEKSTDIITVNDIEASVFKSMLYFIYSDSLPDFVGTSDDEGKEQELRLMAQHLLVAADRYDLERLRLMCEDLLCKSLDVSTVATTLLLVEQHNCSQLKAECFNFVSSPEVLSAVVLTDGFHDLMKSCPSILKDLRVLNFAKDIIFELFCNG